jgi:hypothetical protein
MANANSETYDDARIVAFQPRTGEKRVVVEGGTNPRYLRAGYLFKFVVRFATPKKYSVSPARAQGCEGKHKRALGQHDPAHRTSE